MCKNTPELIAEILAKDFLPFLSRVQLQFRLSGDRKNDDYIKPPLPGIQALFEIYSARLICLLYLSYIMLVATFSI